MQRDLPVPPIVDRITRFGAERDHPSISQVLIVQEEGDVPYRIRVTTEAIVTAQRKTR